MIVVLGMSPAWQQIAVVGELALGEVNRLQSLTQCASGKAPNVALALAALGADPVLVTLLGGDTGHKIDRELEAAGVRRQVVWLEQPTRTCATLLEPTSGRTTELVENAGPATESQIADFERLGRATVGDATVVVVSGSCPKHTPADIFGRILEAGGPPAILDIRGPELLAALPSRPFLVKPNAEELGITLGRTFIGETDLLGGMAELRALGADWVLVSRGPAPALLLGPSGLIRLTPPRVTVVNPIGSGDCVAAGIAWGLEAGLAPVDAVAWGMACGADNVGQLLPARIDLARVQQLRLAVGIDSVPSEHPL